MQNTFNLDRLAELQAVGEALAVVEALAAKRQLQYLIRAIPQQQKCQDSTNTQLHDLRAVAIRLGMHDAADIIRNILERG